MKNLILLATIFLGSFTLAQSVEWKSFEEAEALIKKNPEKQILIYYYTDWCGYCRKMEKETFANAEAANFINTNFIPVKFNVESKENVNFLGYNYSYIAKGKVNSFAFFYLNGQMAYPGTAILDKNSKLSNSLLGYMNPSEYMHRLKNPI